MAYRLKIIGYYKHSNFGDEQYKTSMTKLFSEYLQIDYSIEFIDCDCIYKENFYNDDIIIVGGGDILNPYFMDKIEKKFRNRQNIIIGLSVGLPYASILVQTSKLEILDYIFIRTVQDLDVFTKYFHKDRIFYIPDVSYLLTPNYVFTKRMIATKNTSLDAVFTYTKGKYTNAGVTVPLDHVPPTYGRVALKHDNKIWLAEFYTLFK